MHLGVAVEKFRIELVITGMVCKENMLLLAPLAKVCIHVAVPHLWL